MRWCLRLHRRRCSSSVSPMDSTCTCRTGRARATMR
jgi:hypothetical protein